MSFNVAGVRDGWRRRAGPSSPGERGTSMVTGRNGRVIRWAQAFQG
jgi:hypothetical protein